MIRGAGQRFARVKWRKGSLAETLVEWKPRVVSVVAPKWQDAGARMRNAGSFRVRLMAVSLPRIDGTGDTTRARPWRRDALQRGWGVV